MKIFVQTYGQIRTIVKEPRIELEIPEGSSVFNALLIFADKYGSDVKELLFTSNSDSQIHSFYNIAVDSTTLKHDQLDVEVLKDGSVLSILPFVA
ncbi:MAG: MoaD/ThiS family protein, partial [Candidatus Heimdallarchaeaceae archaeon]